MENFKEPAPAAAPAAKKTINAKCPRTGKDVDPALTFTYKAQLIGFCSAECKGKFEADPNKYIAKVENFKEPKPEEKKPEPAPAQAAKKAINAKCPLSGKDVDPAHTVTYKGQVIGFCCPNCGPKFEKEPAKYIGKVAEFKDPDKKPEEKKPDAAPAKPINKKCPMMPEEDIDPKVTFTYKNQVIAFCCKDCCKEFAKEPEKHIGKVKEFKK